MFSTEWLSAGIHFFYVYLPSFPTLPFTHMFLLFLKGLPLTMHSPAPYAIPSLKSSLNSQTTLRSQGEVKMSSIPPNFMYTERAASSTDWLIDSFAFLFSNDSIISQLETNCLLGSRLVNATAYQHEPRCTNPTNTQTLKNKDADRPAFCIKNHFRSSTFTRDSSSFCYPLENMQRAIRNIGMWQAWDTSWDALF